MNLESQTFCFNCDYQQYTKFIFINGSYIRWTELVFFSFFKCEFQLLLTPQLRGGLFGPSEVLDIPRSLGVLVLCNPAFGALSCM